MELCRGWLIMLWRNRYRRHVSMASTRNVAFFFSRRRRSRNQTMMHLKDTLGNCASGSEMASRQVQPGCFYRFLKRQRSLKKWDGSRFLCSLAAIHIFLRRLYESVAFSRPWPQFNRVKLRTTPPARSRSIRSQLWALSDSERGQRETCLSILRTSLNIGFQKVKKRVKSATVYFHLTSETHTHTHTQYLTLNLTHTPKTICALHPRLWNRQQRDNTIGKALQRVMINLCVSACVCVCVSPCPREKANGFISFCDSNDMEALWFY